MSNIFNLGNITDFSEKIDMDELYEKKQQHDLNQLELFNKILNRIHIRIKKTSTQKRNEQFCWYVIPEIIIGVPKYDQASCIAYAIDKLKNNGFNVRYIHPNTLFISWLHFVPTYVRNEFKKKTGIIVDQFGYRLQNNNTNVITNESITDNENVNETETHSPNNYLLNIKKNQNETIPNNKKEYKPINSYKPSGNLIYDKSLTDKFR
jgi:hypothetical protein